jgi:CHORD
MHLIFSIESYCIDLHKINLMLTHFLISQVAPGLAEQAKLLQQSQTKDLADAFLPFVLPPVGTACKNKSCQVQYEGPQSDQGLCLYHPGFPVFHEGMKFWSCCIKRTSDFDEFLKQKGCETGRHCWDKMKGMTFQVRPNSYFIIKC